MSLSMSRAFLLSATLLFMAVSSPAYAEPQGGHGKKDCKADVARFCPEVKPGEGRLLACLKAHQAQLQPACQAKLPQWEKVQQMKQTCRTDREKFCAQAGRGKETRACMKKNHDLLSEACRGAIEQIKAVKKSGSTASYWDHWVKALS
jgi:hypothetical protein